MRRLALLPLAAALALAAAPSPADPFTGHFDDLLVEMNLRDGGIPNTGLTAAQKRQRAGLRSAFRALSTDSADLGGDLAMARRMAGALEKGFPGDGTMGGLLAALNDGLRGEVDGERDDAVVLISIAREGRTRDRAEARLAAADALFLAAAEAPTQARRARGTERGYRAVLRAAALAVKAGTGGSGDGSAMTATVAGEPWAANSKFGTAVTGLADVSEATSALRRIVVSGRRILPLSTDDRLPGETTRIQITLLSATSDIVPGIYLTGNSNGVNASASWYREDEDESVSQAVSLSGTIELTSLAVHEGSVDVAGTFAITMYDGLADAVFDIASGAFEVSGLPRAAVP